MIRMYDLRRIAGEILDGDRALLPDDLALRLDNIIKMAASFEQSLRDDFVRDMGYDVKALLMGCMLMLEVVFLALGLPLWIAIPLIMMTSDKTIRLYSSHRHLRHSTLTEGTD